MLVARDGLSLYVFRFIKVPTANVLASGIKWKDVLQFWAPGIAYLVMLAGGAATAEIGQSLAHNRSVEFIGAVLFAVGFLGLPIFLCSVGVTALKYRVWLRSITKQHKA